ncbi:MAG: restriction endonuclease subunit S, partial [Nitrososphaeria archaeon]
MSERMTFYRETEFKDTEIGRIPKEWEVRRLNEIAELCRGLSYSGEEKSINEIPDGYLFLTLNSIKEAGGLKEDGWSWIKSDRLKERHFVREGDIVIANTEQSKDGSLLGSPAIVRFPKWYQKDRAAFSHHISKLTPRVENIDIGFLLYYLAFVQPLAKNYHTGTGVWGLDVDTWSSDLLISIPPFKEQQQIASILSTIGEAIQKTDEVIAKTERLKKGMMQELLTKGIGHKEFKDTE